MQLIQVKISPGLMNKAYSIYSPIPWFRLTLMDLTFKALFYQFQITFNWIKTELHVSVVTGTNEQM